MTSQNKLILEDETYRILGACFEVYRDKGCGFLEPVYQECLAIEMTLRDIPFVEQEVLHLQYKGHELKHVYQPDFLCFRKVILEIKAVDKLVDEHRAQLLNYLHATKMQVGLLVNFGHYPKLQYQRFVLTEKDLSSSTWEGSADKPWICREVPLQYDLQDTSKTPPHSIRRRKK